MPWYEDTTRANERERFEITDMEAELSIMAELAAERDEEINFGLIARRPPEHSLWYCEGDERDEREGRAA